MATKVIDISKWQNTFAPAAARAASIEGVILRHAYAAGADELALGWAGGIKAVGLPLGGYGFATWHYRSRNGGSVATARALMRKQVAKWIELAKASGCDYWFAVDQELEAGQTMGLGKADNTALLNEACDLLAEAGLHPCVYCSVAWDFNYIRTADLRYPYWMARYVDGMADFGESGSSLDALPDGKYTRWMRQLFDAGRLVGWQFASTGMGAKYGVGSAGIDRNVFYLQPAGECPEPLPVQPEASAQYVLAGPMSEGDAHAVEARIAQMAVGSDADQISEGEHAGQWFVWTTIPVSTGDQAALITLAVELEVPVELSDTLPTEEPAEPDKPDETYSVVYLGFVVKGGFEDEAAAQEYIESVLGKDAIKRLGMTVEV